MPVFLEENKNDTKDTHVLGLGIWTNEYLMRDQVRVRESDD